MERANDTAPGLVRRSLGPISRVPVGEGRAFRVGELFLAVFRTRQGRVFVTQATCPHRGGPLFDGVIDDRCVVCPLHARRFDLETGAPSGEGCSPLETYTATVEASGEIVAFLPASACGEAGSGHDDPAGEQAGAPADEPPDSSVLDRARGLPAPGAPGGAPDDQAARRHEMTNDHEAAPTEGRGRTLFACFLHFDLSFMLWVLVGALGIFIADELSLTPLQKGLIVATPIASGTLLRIPLGALSDRVGGRRVGVAMLMVLFAPLAWGYLGGRSFAEMLLVGALLGTAGASFSVALPLASRWYPKEKQGLVLGLAAAGNSGAVVTNLLAPRLARVFGWHGVMGLSMAPLALVLLVFALLARESPAAKAAAPRSAREVFGQPDLAWFCWFYGVTFGGYVGLSGFLPLFLRDQYGLDPVMAGTLTGLAAFVGSASRPLGGYLADRMGGVPLLSWLLPCIALGYGACAALPPLAVLVAVVVVTMASLGLGNGAVFQLVPQRFHAEMGLVTGIVGAVGGVGGALLPTVLGGVKGATGSFSLGFVVLCALAASSALRLRSLASTQQAWKLSFQPLRAAG